jgi:hypothetical protein
MAMMVTAACSERKRSPPDGIDPHYGREVPLEYQKVFRKPKLADLRKDGADDATVRSRWAAEMSKLGSVASLRADGATLVVTYTGAVSDRVCEAPNWAKIYDLPALGFTRVRCSSGGEAAVPDDGGKAQRKRLVDRAHGLVSPQDVGLVWHESEGMVLTAIIEKGKCNRARLSKLAAAIKKGGIDLRAAGFEKLVCSVDDGELAL